MRGPRRFFAIGVMVAAVVAGTQLQGTETAAVMQHELQQQSGLEHSDFISSILERLIGPPDQEPTFIIRASFPAPVEDTVPAVADIDSSTQEEELESILDEIDPRLVIASNQNDRRPVFERRGLSMLISSPIAVLAAHSQPTESPRLPILITSRGVSSGEAFTVQISNPTSKPISFPRRSFTLQPLKKDAGERAMQQFKTAQGRVTTLTLYGYCLNYRKQAPKAGTVYTLAPKPMQDRNEGVREILRSVSAMRARRLLVPEGDTKEYLHSIRQWALWTREQNFTQASFTEAMVQHAQKSVRGSGKSWSKDVETALRQSASKRWHDVQRVLMVADAVARIRARTPSRGY